MSSVTIQCQGCLHQSLCLSGYRYVRSGGYPVFSGAGEKFPDNFAPLDVNNMKVNISPPLSMRIDRGGLIFTFMLLTSSGAKLSGNFSPAPLNTG